MRAVHEFPSDSDRTTGWDRLRCAQERRGNSRLASAACQSAELNAPPRKRRRFHWAASAFWFY